MDSDDKAAIAVSIFQAVITVALIAGAVAWLLSGLGVGDFGSGGDAPAGW
jgi:hypothetical protein